MRLRAAESADVDAIMAWFPDESSIRNWAGPNFDYPFDRASFHRDCKWRDMASFCVDSHGVLQGFGQFYNRYGRANLARLVVSPESRGCGLGQFLVNALIEESRSVLGLSEAGLFVYRNNESAYCCYRAAGFEVAAMPDDVDLGDESRYLVRTIRPARVGS
ncbi:MAG: GNAT family N-acetyltransferase [Woeseiaceae bacterium]|nr:GNAT family N-acetyltransferase [Woeseiaceae bacterium]